MSHSELNQRAQIDCPFNPIFYYIEANMLVSFSTNKCYNKHVIYKFQLFQMSVQTVALFRFKT